MMRAEPHLAAPSADYRDSFMAALDEPYLAESTLAHERERAAADFD
jgi:hypothetical protein